jgi:DNA-binding NarL/FixJ family response regulator
MSHKPTVLSNNDVAGRRYISPRTVDFHLCNGYTKLAITSRTELAALALRPALMHAA